LKNDLDENKKADCSEGELKNNLNKQSVIS